MSVSVTTGTLLSDLISEKTSIKFYPTDVSVTSAFTNTYTNRVVTMVYYMDIWEKSFRQPYRITLCKNISLLISEKGHRMS